MKKQQGIDMLFAAVAIVVIAILFVAVLLATKKSVPQTTQMYGTSDIQNDSDLTSAGSELDNANVDAIDTNLQTLDNESSTL